MKLPNSVEAKISQFGDDTTLTCRDVNVFRENMDVLNKLNEICCLKFNKKLKQCGLVPLKIIKPNLWVSNLSRANEVTRERNNDLNVFVKIHRETDTELNMWQTGDF